MAYWNRQESYKQDKAILKSTENVSTPLTVNITASSIGYTKTMKQTVPPGLFVGLFGTTYRFLPRTRLAAVTLAAGNSFTLVDASLFKVGDVLKAFDTTLATPTLVAIGTIASVDYMTGIVTTNGTAVADRPVGYGVQVQADEIVGIYPKSIDFINQPSVLIAPVTKAEAIYELALPYYDAQLKALLGVHLGIRKWAA